MRQIINEWYYDDCVVAARDMHISHVQYVQDWIIEFENRYAHMLDIDIIYSNNAISKFIHYIEECTERDLTAIGI